MAFEVVKNIVEAEKEVENIKNLAMSKSQDLINNAVNKAEQMIADVKTNAKTTQTTLTAAAVNACNVEVEKIIAEAARQCENIKNASEGKKETAIKAVIGKVVGIDGDS